MLDSKVDDVARRDTRASLVEVAAQLLREQGPSAVTTRAVAQAAGVQAPTIYRLFGDKEGLLDAVAEYAFAAHVAGKAPDLDRGDPLDDLRAGWDVHVGFGLANPALFTLLADPGRGSRSPAAAAGAVVLRARVHRVAATGRLRVSEQRAVDLIRAAGTGAVLTLLSMPPEERDLGLADAVFDAVMHAVLTGEPAPGIAASGTAVPGTAASGAGASGSAGDDVTSAAVAFRTVVPRLARLTDGERALLAEWLDRAIGD